MKTVKEHIVVKLREHYDKLKLELEQAYADCRTIEERVLQQNREVILARAKRAKISADFADAGDRLNGFTIDSTSALKRNSARTRYARLLAESQDAN